MTKLLLFCVATLLTISHSTAAPTRMLGEYEIEYISDRSMFYTEGQDNFPDDLKRPLDFAKAVLASYLEKQIKGVYSIARASHGYHVTFTRLTYLKDTREWDYLQGGFGDIFVSVTLSRIQIDYGP